MAKAGRTPEHTVTEKVAIAMRQRWGELDPDTDVLIPWEKSDKQEVWLAIAQAGINVYEAVKK